MGVIRYDQAPAGTFDPNKILLQADPVTGDLTKITLDTLSQWIAATGGINYSAGNVGINNSTPVQPLHIDGSCDGFGIGPLKVESNTAAGIGVALTLKGNPTYGGKEFSFLTTENAAGPGGGVFAVLNNDIPAYVFSVNDKGQYISAQNFFSFLAQITAKVYDAATKGFLIQLANSQTANALEITDAASNPLFTIDQDTNITTSGFLEMFTPSSGNYIKLLPYPASTIPEIHLFFSTHIDRTISLSPTDYSALYTDGAMEIADCLRTVGIALGDTSGTLFTTTPNPGQLILSASGGANTNFINFTQHSAFFGYNLGMEQTTGDLKFLSNPSSRLAFDGTETLRLTRNSNNVVLKGSADDSSSALTLDSTTQGIGLPVMTTSQKNAITTPRTGLLVFDSTLGSLSVYDGSNWV